MLRRWIAHPLTRGKSIDDPDTTDLRRQIIQAKPFLRRIYQEWYESILQHIPSGQGAVLELGSGAGFFDEYVSGLIKSEVFPCDNVHLVADARNLPFPRGALRAIVMSDVLHHIPDVYSFFLEAVRCLRPGGKIVMIEPWVSAWSKLIYKYLHHEPFEPNASTWSFPESGPLSGANGALPWIVFERDRRKFNEQFPELVLETISPTMPFRYLVSGGVSTRNVMPLFSMPLWVGLERVCGPRMKQMAMFSLIALRRA